MSRKRLQQLDQQLAELGVPADQLIERFCRAGGPGGQHVNRTATAVQLQHPPSGLEVRAEGERSQLRNRIAAREQLIDRIEQAQARAEAERVAAEQRARRRRRRPPPAARARTLDTKRRRGTVKRLRGRIDETD